MKDENGDEFPGPLLRTGEVAAIFRVHPKTVGLWARRGKLHPIKTLGGHSRYREVEVNSFLAKRKETKAR